MVPASLPDRLKLARKNAGLTQQEVADALHQDQSTVAHWERGGKTKPSPDKVEAFARLTGVDAEWVLYGRGKGPAATLGPKRKRPHVDEVASNGEPTLFSTSLREIDVSASAGGGAIVEAERTAGEWRFPTDWLRHELRGKADKNGLYVITIEGDSMRGTLDDGDKVLVDVHRTAPSPPGVFILHDGLALVAKRLEFIEGSEPQRVRILSDNQHYRPYERSVEEVKIIGRVVARWQRL